MHGHLPISYLDYQVGVIYNRWVFSKLVIGDDVFHEPLYDQNREKKRENYFSACLLVGDNLPSNVEVLRALWVTLFMSTFGYFRIFGEASTQGQRDVREVTC